MARRKRKVEQGSGGSRRCGWQGCRGTPPAGKRYCVKHEQWVRRQMVSSGYLQRTEEGPSGEGER
jgi:hypothetical protein